MFVIGSSPEIQTSKRTIVYKESKWKVHRFSICSGEVIAVVEVLKMCGSVFLWVCSPGQNTFSELALGVPATFRNDDVCDNKATATTILGPVDSMESSGLARRLASLLKKPVYVSFNIVRDRFISPLIEKGLMMEIKNNSDYF